MSRESLAAEIDRIDAKICALQEKRNKLESQIREFDKEVLYRSVEKKKISIAQLNKLIGMSDAEIARILAENNVKGADNAKKTEDEQLPGQYSVNEEGEVV